MDKPSLTANDSFLFRIQRSEKDRAVFMCGLYGALILLTIARRLEGGIVMAENSVFFSYLGVLAAAMGFEAFVVRALASALRQNRLVIGWRLTVAAAIELAVPTLAMLILHFWSPRGQYAALSSPVLLLFPLTVLLSVLRLRPRMTLWLGLGAAIIHAVLAVLTIASEDLSSDQYAVLLSYAAILALTGIAGMLVTLAARRYVREAIDEAEAREQASLRLAGMERDIEVARQIQVGLLPAGPPSFPGFDISGMNRPADKTGGDYYDWQLLPDGRLLAVIADVTGHGIGPALVMAVCRAYARASAPLDASPASLMARLNTLLVADDIGGRFVTLAMAMLDSAGQIELVSAGHGPTMLFRAATRTIEQFGGDGLPLAVMAGQDYAPTRRLRMDSGDVLIMLTDGVIEWQNSANVQFGATRLQEVLMQAASLPAAQIVERVNQAVLAHAAGSAQNDDVTILVIKRTP